MLGVVGFSYRRLQLGLTGPAITTGSLLELDPPAPEEDEDGNPPYPPYDPSHLLSLLAPGLPGQARGGLAVFRHAPPGYEYPPEAPAEGEADDAGGAEDDGDGDGEGTTAGPSPDEAAAAAEAAAVRAAEVAELEALAARIGGPTTDVGSLPWPPPTSVAPPPPPGPADVLAEAREWGFELRDVLPDPPEPKVAEDE